MSRSIATATIFSLSLLAGCGKGESPPTPPAVSAETEPADPPLPTVAGLVTVEPRYLTERDPQDNVDSVATWHGPEDQHWLIATAKETDRLLVYDASNGKPLRKFGASGTALGQFERPNGVFVLDALAFVVERDNRRVQVLRLPGFEPLLHFGSDGETPLRKPYGLWVRAAGAGAYQVFVTDSYETADEKIPPAAELDRRVHVYRLVIANGTGKAQFEKTFGATQGLGVLQIVESIWGDPANDRLLVADEEEYQQRNIKVYDLEGRFTGRRVGAGIFHFQPEGIALYPCADGSGWWFGTDQGKQENFFHLFDRRTLEYRGSFGSPRVLNTDGIWLDQAPMPGFDHGALFAVHDDGNVAAFDLGVVLDRLKVQRCESR